jgi:anthranilate phosphoribosyltransferase
MSEPPVYAQVINELSGRGGVRPELVRQAFDCIFAGTWTPVQIAGFLVGLRVKGDDAELICAAAQSMRAVMVGMDHDFAALLDTCGTGGDGSHTVNLSTGAAIIAAAAGAMVAKHGNRAATSKSGSADVLESLGVPLDVVPARQVEVLREAGIAFLFAQAHHPAIRFAMPVRRELGVRTVFNCLGPLANPARVSHQLLGAYDDTIRPILADALRGLGTKRAWVVRSVDGMDEVSPHAVTRVTQLSSGKLEELEIAPEDFGLARLPEGAIRGGEPADNARVLQAVLAGEPHPSRDAFILNAAAALCVALELSPRAAAERAREVIDNGTARKTLERWKTAASERRSP